MEELDGFGQKSVGSVLDFYSRLTVKLIERERYCSRCIRGRGRRLGGSTLPTGARPSRWSEAGDDEAEAAGEAAAATAAVSRRSRTESESHRTGR